MNPYRSIRKIFAKSVVGSAFLSFSFRDRTKMVVVQIIQMLLSILDFFGILLIGVIGSLSISGISGSNFGDTVKKIVDFFGLSNQSLQMQITVIGTFAAVFLIAKTVVSLILTNRAFSFLANRGAEFSSNMVDKLLSKTLKEVQEKSIQELIYTVTGGVNAWMVGVLGGWFNLISDIALLVILGSGLFLIDSGIAVFMASLFVIVAIGIYKKIGKEFGILGSKQANLSVQIAQSMSEIVLAFRENFVRDRSGFYSEKFQKIEYEMARGNSRINLVSMYTKYIFEVVFVLTAVAISAYVFVTEPVTRAVAILSIFLATSMRVIPAVVRIQQGISKIKIQAGYAEKAILIMRSIKDAPGTTPSLEFIPRQHDGFSADISIENAKFRFENNDWLLAIDKIEIKSGEFVAFVGSSGAGKTTLVDLILGLRTVHSGRISISGLNPWEAILKWPGAIAYVPQDSAIIQGSILDNLTLGFSSQKINEAFAWEALGIAHLDDFVNSLPEGMNTFVGDRGTSLSGGQRQRLGIARAFMTNPKLIFLDEATSSLDGEIESSISETILGMKGKVTVVMVAHRLSTIVEADRIYYLKNGKIEGVGNFQYLKQINSDFARQAEIMGL